MRRASSNATPSARSDGFDPSTPTTTRPLTGEPPAVSWPTTSTGHRACVMTCMATAPTLVRLKTPWPMAPTTTRAAEREASTRAWLA